MKLNKKSWHAWIYQMTFGFETKRFWGAENPIPDNLCPYFWQFISAMLLSIVFLPFCSVYYLFKYSHEKDNDYKYGYFKNSNIGCSFTMNTIVLLVVAMVGMWFNLDFKGPNFLTMTGTVGYVILLLVIIVLTHEKIKKTEWYKKWKYKEIKPQTTKERRPNILVEFVKAKYNKYCPKIEWYDNQNK